MWPDEWMRRGRESAMRRCHRRARREQGRPGSIGARKGRASRLWSTAFRRAIAKNAAESNSG